MGAGVLTAPGAATRTFASLARRIHGGSAETGYCEGDDEGADGEIFHVRVSPWAGLKISKDFSGQTR
jgi:hypothetical protein